MVKESSNPSGSSTIKGSSGHKAWFRSCVVWVAAWMEGEAENEFTNDRHKMAQDGNFSRLGQNRRWSGDSTDGPIRTSSCYLAWNQVLFRKCRDPTSHQREFFRQQWKSP
jgi:hypothetical protein